MVKGVVKGVVKGRPVPEHLRVQHEDLLLPDAAIRRPRLNLPQLLLLRPPTPFRSSARRSDEQVRFE